MSYKFIPSALPATLFAVAVGCGEGPTAADEETRSTASAARLYEDPQPSRDPCPPCRVMFKGDDLIYGVFQIPPDLAHKGPLSFKLEATYSSGSRPIEMNITGVVGELDDGLYEFELQVAEARRMSGFKIKIYQSVSTRDRTVLFLLAELILERDEHA